MVKLFGHEKVTNSGELHDMGRTLFGKKFVGVFPQDKVPSNIAKGVKQKYFILNLDKSDEPGSHWVGVLTIPNSTRLLIFDSFGRSSKKILPFLRTIKSIDTDSDAEQKILQDSCGQFTMAWLKFADEYGWENAKLI